MVEWLHTARRICHALYATVEAALPKRGERPFKDNYARRKKLVGNMTEGHRVAAHKRVRAYAMKSFLACILPDAANFAIARPALRFGYVALRA